MSTRAKKYASKKRPARGSYSRAAKKYSMGFNRQAALTVRNPPRGLQLKTVDRDLGGGQPILNTGAVACFTLLNGCGEGASFYTRVGRRIAGKSLMLKLNLTATATALANQRAPIVRCLVIYDRQANGAYPADPVPAGLVAVSAVLQDITAAGGVAAPITVNYGAPNGNVLCGLNMNNTDRFLILADSVHSVANTANVGASTIDGKSACIWKYIALKNLETHFTTSNDDIAGISTGAIHLLMISDTADSIQFSLAARYRFSDL